ALAGQKAEAVATLARLVGRNPAWLAWRLAADPELASVAGAPELAAGTRPTGSATAAGPEQVPIAHAAALGLIGYRSTNERGLSDYGEESLDLVDENSGKTVVSMPLHSTAISKKKNAESAAQATRVLAALGFEPVAAAAFIKLEKDDAGKARGVFPGT